MYMATERCSGCGGSGQTWASNADGYGSAGYVTCAGCAGTGSVWMPDPPPKHQNKQQRNPRGNSNSCFPENCQIETENGKSKISDLEYGQLIKSYDFEKKSFVFGQLTELQCYQNAVISQLSFSGIEQSLLVTGHHRLFDGAEWKYVRDLKEGDSVLYDENGELSEHSVVNINREYSIAPVFNIVVYPYANFFADGYLASSHSTMRAVRKLIFQVMFAAENMTKKYHNEFI